jgi:small subunit ribosomal protein S6
LKTIAKKLYEAMFLVDSAEAAADWDGVNATIRKILERAGADIVSVRKWDERRLAYQVNGKERGTHILCYFRADGESITGIERDVQLSERIMRVLILCADHMSPEDVEKDTPVERVEKRLKKASRDAAKKQKAEQAPDKEAPKDSPGAVEDEPKPQQRQEPQEEEPQEAEPAPDKESLKDSPGAVEDEPKPQQLQEPQEEKPQEEKPDDLEKKE